MYSLSSFLPNNLLENLTELITFSNGSSANSCGTNPMRSRVFL